MSKRDEVRQKWAQIVAGYHQAGRSQAAFAAEQKVGLPALRYWIQKLRGEPRPSAGQAPRVRVLPVQVTGLELRGIELRVGEVTIVLPAATPAAYVAEVASALGGSRC